MATSGVSPTAPYSGLTRRTATWVIAGRVRWSWLLSGPSGCVELSAEQLTLREVEPGSMYADLYCWVAGIPWKPMDFGYHSLTSTAGVGDVPTDTACEVLGGRRPCYYQGSGIRAYQVLQKWAADGMDDRLLWVALYAQYLLETCPPAGGRRSRCRSTPSVSDLR